MMTDHQLLADYARAGSEAAFRELVARYINLVFSTATRLVNGDTHLAEDVAQTVFTDLARLAGTLAQEVVLGGWLHRRTCHVATTLMRGIRRRQNRERQAAEMNALEHPSKAAFEEIAPVLDEAINQLKAEDRAAIMLRFFENRDLRYIGQALGSNEDAVQKRVGRALEKLRLVLTRRGIAASTGVLAALLGAQAVTAAPMGLAAVVGSAALAKAATSGGIALTLIKVMAMTNVKIALGTLVVAGLGTALVLEHQALKELRLENAALGQQIDRVARQSVSSDQPFVAHASNSNTSSTQADQLRDQINALRRQTNDLAKMRDINRRWRGALAGSAQPGVLDSPEEADFKEQTLMRVQHLKQWGLSFHMYASDHNNQLPKTFEQAVKVQNMDSFLEFDTNHFEIIYHGSVTNPNVGDYILFRETTARPVPTGGFVKIYGMADGSVQTVGRPNESDFAEYEKKHLAPAH